MAEREGSSIAGAVGSFWQWWRRVGKKIGDLQAQALLSFFYYVVFAPFALAVRWLCDPLAIKNGSPRGVAGQGGKQGYPGRARW